MATRMLVAGATGAIGSRLVPLLVQRGHETFGTTRSTEKARRLADAGVRPLVVDAFDRARLTDALLDVRPDVVIHQLTDLPPGLSADRMEEAVARNARIRSEGTRNLVDAALAGGARRLVAQSIAWAYAPGPEPHAESDPLDWNAEGTRAVTVGGVMALEAAVLDSPPLQGTVLRYGQIHGPGTGSDVPRGTIPLHVDAAAWAAVLAAEGARPGVFNIAEPNDHVATDKARAELGWDPAFRLDLPAPSPT